MSEETLRHAVDLLDDLTGESMRGTCLAFVVAHTAHILDEARRTQETLGPSPPPPATCVALGVRDAAEIVQRCRRFDGNDPATAHLGTVVSIGYEGMVAEVQGLLDRLAEAERERDSARAEVERLREALTKVRVLLNNRPSMLQAEAMAALCEEALATAPEAKPAKPETKP